jgi:hypothetical protein
VLYAFVGNFSPAELLPPLEPVPKIRLNMMRFNSLTAEYKGVNLEVQPSYKLSRFF